MNQQLIFNHDHQFDDAAVAVRCSILQGGLRNTVYIRMPEGWTAEAWLAQVREDSFFWEDEIELALKKGQLDPDGSLWLDGAV
ncbi:DUF1488 domain-containing protein [Rheinheimera texasensis]|uniref:DUF1488 domain-containing protein n=1 Tax=Rheinheimera texasensis TaxID=306205 RepID=UPI0032B114AE